jgi:hypothetical protein
LRSSLNKYAPVMPAPAMAIFNFQPLARIDLIQSYQIMDPLWPPIFGCHVGHHDRQGKSPHPPTAEIPFNEDGHTIERIENEKLK